MTYRLLVIACSERKKAGPAWLEAIERYDGPVWQSVRAIQVPGNVAIMALSARYGLFRSCLGIELYDDRMTPELAAAAIAGEVCDPFKPYYRPHWKATVNEVRDAQEAVRYRHATRYAEPFEDICIVGSAEYLAVMRHELRRIALWRGQVSISRDARLTEASGMIGRMRETMLDWICESPRISCSKLVDITAGKEDYTPIAQRNRSPPHDEA